MVDTQWREHLAAMDYMRQGIFLRSYAQKNPKQEYKREAFELFSGMLERIKFDTVSLLARMQIRSETEIERQEQERKARLEQMMQFQHAEPPPVPLAGREEAAVAPSEAAPGVIPNSVPFQRAQPKVGRNDVCPCGSGKKFKYCHGQLDASASATAQADEIGRNDPCPCGSGKKYKHCHGGLA